MVPVIVLSDGYLANGAEPWLDPRPEEPPGHRRPLPHRAGGLPTVRAGRGDAGAAVGASGHAGSRAPHRRPREAGRHRQRVLRPGQPRPDGAAAGARRSDGWRRRSRPPRSTARRAATSWWSGGAGRTARSPRPSRKPRRRAVRCQHPPPAPEPAPARPRPDPAPVPTRARAGDQQRASSSRRPACGVPGGRRRLQPRAGRAAQPTQDLVERDHTSWLEGQPDEHRHERAAGTTATRRRTSSPTRTCAGARAAGTTRSCRPSRR